MVEGLRAGDEFGGWSGHFFLLGFRGGGGGLRRWGICLKKRLQQLLFRFGGSPMPCVSLSFSFLHLHPRQKGRKLLKSNSIDSDGFFSRPWGGDMAEICRA